MPKNIEPNLLAAERKALEIIDRFAITIPDEIKIEALCDALGVKVILGQLDGAAARLVRYGDRGTIRIADSETNLARRRFSIAHELGHFVLNHGVSMHILEHNDIWESEKLCKEEKEANAFAQELLLPRTLIERKCQVEQVSLDHIKRLTEIFNTSLTATAMRFVRFCNQSCALVFSKEAQIRWFRKNDYFLSYIPIHNLDNRTIASRFFQGNALPDEPVEVESDAWIGGNGYGFNKIMEHSVSSANYGFVLSLLWINKGS
ncbi:MAG: ImmA/IrrE family metallo-endopeptidase [Thermodesulfobacteriota bacterium]